MSKQGIEREPLTIGEQVADVELTEKLGGGGGIHAWTGTREDGSKRVVFALDGGLGLESRDRFLTAASDAAGVTTAGIVPILSVDPIAGAYVGDLDASGTFADLPILNWNQKRRVALFKRICEIVAGLHDQGTAHGWLRPENILLDANLEPVVANAQLIDIGTMCRTDAGMVWLHRVYVPPEVRHGATADARADTYALGRLFHFALAGAESDEKDERLPRLDSLLKDNPNPLVRIIRKCTSMDSAERYANAREIVEELERVPRHIPVGAPHPEIDGNEESSMVDDERFRSRPPPKKPPRSTGVAVELTAPVGGNRFWSVGMAIGFGIIGFLMLGIPLLATFVAGVEAFGLSMCLWLSAIPIGLATPGFGPNKLLSRVLIVAAVAGLLVFTGPLEAIRNARNAGLKSDDVNERVATVKELIAQGVKDFRTVDLSGGDVSGIDFSNTELDGMKLRNANCNGANFTNASMENVDVGSADLTGANMRGTIGPFMVGLETAKCSATTSMPGGYVCRDGAPLPSAGGD